MLNGQNLLSVTKVICWQSLVKFFMSILMSLLSLLTDLLKWTRLVSSAKWWTLQNFIAWLRSLLYIKSKSHLRCDTIFYRGSIRTIRTWIICLQYHICHNVQVWLSCSTVSKAFHKSTEVQQSIFPLSNFFMLSSVRLIKVGPSPFQKNYTICLISVISISPVKIMKNVF